MATLYEHQKEAIRKMKNGCVLRGGVGTGKSLTAVEYYAEQYGGTLNGHVKMKNPEDLYIITTAKKRDKRDWEKELNFYGLSDDKDINYYNNVVIVDSWNNIKKYINIKNSFFIFDEQRTVGSGTWAKSFIKIAENNKWIMLSATPGDDWCDYRALFVANGFYRNMTDFDHRHVIYSPFVKYKQVDRYIDTDILEHYKNDILVEMPYVRKTKKNINIVPCKYDKYKYRILWHDRVNIYDDNKPIDNMVTLCYMTRKMLVLTSDRMKHLNDILNKHNRIIIFYNFNYELEMINSFMKNHPDIPYKQYNGKVHDDVPQTNSYVYAVQYTAGAEGWNCITSDTIVFFTPNYSYKIMEQSSGRIDRLNTPYVNLYYYLFISSAPIDRSILRCLKEKRKFNSKKFGKNITF